jgi:outer membrane receptor protein involved in Fe transport
MLNPTIDNSDPKNIRQGNPYLKPDYTDSYDLSWHLTTSNSNLLASIFYRYTTDLMTMTRTSNSEGVGIVEFQNMNWSKNLGVDLTYSYRFGMLGNVMISGSAFHNTTNAANLDVSNESDSWNWNARINGMMMVSRTTSIQVMGMYMAPRELPTGKMWGMSSIDVGIKQDLFKRKASILLNVSDILNTRRMNTVNELSGYYFEMHRQFTSRVATLTFTYRFGKVNDSKKKPNMQQNMQQDNQMQMDSF